MERKQIKGKRFYNSDPNWYPSVTTIIHSTLAKSKKLEDWTLKQAINYIKKEGTITDETLSRALHYPQNYLQHLADEGSKKHKAIEHYLRTKEEQEPELIKQFKQWEQKYEFKFLKGSIRVKNKKYKYAGEIDLIGNIGSKLAIIDIKSSADVYLTHKIQVVSYKYAYCPEAICGILPLRDTNKFYIVSEEEEKLLWKVFILLVYLFNILWKLDAFD